MYNTGELSCNWMATNGFKVKIGNKWFIVVCLRFHQNLKPAAHGEERAEQTVSRGGFLSRFLAYAGNFWWEIHLARPWGKNQTCLMFLPSRGKFLIVCGHRGNRVELGQSSIQLKYIAFSRDFSDVALCSSDIILNCWIHVSMQCIFIGCLIKPSSARFSRWPHTERNLSRVAKNIKHVWFYPHGLARRISHHNFPVYVRKTAE